PLTHLHPTCLAPACICHMFWFFIYRYGHHLYLPSFPTRRSSDLRALECALPEQVVHERSDREPDLRPQRLVVGLEHGELRAAVQDRKSTRLNSSHVKISYAVFCLKKKI